jgi:hypothetical protein
MATDIRKKTINGREIEYLDVIHHHATIQFSVWDRIKILIGKKVVVSSDIYVMSQCCIVSGSEAVTRVYPLIQRKSKGFVYSAMTDNSK